MPPYLTHIEFWKSIWPMVGTVLLLALVVSLLNHDRKQRLELFLVVLGFSALGMVTGYLTGLSRESAVGAVLPAVLSLMGGLMVFLIGKAKESRNVVSISIVVFSFTLLLGSGWGAVMRDVAEKYNKGQYYLQYLKQQAYIEAEVNELRNALKLAPLKNSDSGNVELMPKENK
jgi:hypothetical protein